MKQQGHGFGCTASGVVAVALQNPAFVFNGDVFAISEY